MKVQELMAWVVLAGVGAEIVSADVTILINPREAYVRTNGDAGSLTAVPISLSSTGYGPGDTIRLERLGGFRARVGGAENEQNGMTAVFSSSATILAATNLARVPGAVAAIGGIDVITPATFSGRLPTDIPQDFLVAQSGETMSVTVTIPPEAAFIFVSAIDSFYNDNNDADLDFRIFISRGCRADFNNDGFLDFFDYDDYINCFESGTCPPGLTADFNGDDFVDFFDYDDYVRAFEAGC